MTMGGPFDWLLLFCLSSMAAFTVCNLTERPRGVPLQSVPFYKADSDGYFVCVDGNGRIPYDQLNDDYCDCADSSDEPGTSACHDGHFTCVNRGFVPTEILSSRVNDHVCDCCDGSDEYNSGKKCKDTCAQERAKQMKKFKVLNAGYEKRQQLINDAAKELKEKKAKLAEVQKNVDQERAKLDELEEKKKAAEAPEKEAKDRHEAMARETREARENEAMLSKSAEAFEEIDVDADQKVTLHELNLCASIDGGTNQCGVTEEEIKEWFPVDVEALSIDQFRSLIWKGKLDSLFRSAAEIGSSDKASVTAEPPESDEEIENDDPAEIDDEPDDDDDPTGEEDEEDEEEEVKDRRYRKGRFFELGKKPKEEEKSMKKDEDDVPMDPETLKLIDIANEAREACKEQKKVVEKAEAELRDLEKQINLDLGPDSSFYSLLNQCFDFKEKEYTYTFCPFDKASQKPRNGGETSLGRWGEWAGPNDNKYSQMKMTKGQRCWNGPDRSLTVHFECGEENQILSTSEPSMCEYVMYFKTPAICTTFYDFETQQHIHEDL